MKKIIKIKKYCLVCQKMREVYPSSNKIGKGRFCSKSCASLFMWRDSLMKAKIIDGMKKHLPKTGFKKGQHVSVATEFKLGQIPWNKDKKGVYSQEALRNMSNASKGRIPTEEHRRKVSEKLKGKIVSVETRKHMSEAQLKMVKEGRHNNYKGGITSLRNQIYNSFEYKQWSKEIKEIWDYTCQICGEKGGRLRSHHIKNFANYPELRFETENGIVLCRRCDDLWVLRKEPQWESYFNFCWENKMLREQI